MWAWSLVTSFLGPFGMLLRPPLIYVLILVATHGAVWVKATWVERGKCDAAILRIELAQKDARIKALEDAIAANEKIIRETKGEIDALESTEAKLKEDLENAIAERDKAIKDGTADTCPWTPDDLTGLWQAHHGWA